MEHVIVGLGNPGDEYEHTRHNIGRKVVQQLADKIGATEWRVDKTLRAQVAQGVVSGTEHVRLVLPDNYMNRSGGAVAPLIKNAKQASRLIVVHDDIDLPLGTLRLVFDRGSGGHRGVESIIRTLKTKAFMRLRIGVLPTTPSGKAKKPRGEQTVYDFILKQVSAKDKAALDAVVKRAVAALSCVVVDGREAAMREYHTAQKTGRSTNVRTRRSAPTKQKKGR